MHCTKFGWNWPSGSGEEVFKNFINVISLFRISPWTRARPFIWTNLNPSPQRMLGWNWSSGSGEEDDHVKSWRWRQRRQQRQRWTTDKAHLSLRLRWAEEPFKFNPIWPTYISRQQEASKVLQMAGNITCYGVHLSSLECLVYTSLFLLLFVEDEQIVHSGCVAGIPHINPLWSSVMYIFFVTPRVLSHNFDISRVSINSSFLHRRNPRLITLRSSLYHRGTKRNQHWVPTMSFLMIIRLFLCNYARNGRF